MFVPLCAQTKINGKGGGRGANSTRNRGNLHLSRLLKEEGERREMTVNAVPSPFP